MVEEQARIFRDRPAGRNCQGVPIASLKRALVVTTATAAVWGATVVGFATAVVSGQSMFIAAVMARLAFVALTVPRLICVEVVKRLRPALRKRSDVPVIGS